MADEYTWNHPHSIDRTTIEDFLRAAGNRIDHYPGDLPFQPQGARLVLAWLRGLVDRRPSEMSAPTPENTIEKPPELPMLELPMLSFRVQVRYVTKGGSRARRTVEALGRTYAEAYAAAVDRISRDGPDRTVEGGEMIGRPIPV